MDTSQPDIALIAGIVILVIFLIFAIWFLQKFIKDINQGRGPMGSTIKQTRAAAQEGIEVAKESMGVARESIQTGKELLATQKETNELLKRILARLEKQP